LDFAYYSKKLQRLFRKKIIAFFPDFSTILAKIKNNYASYVFRLQLERCFFRQSVITTSSKNALILHVLKEYSYSSDVSKKKKNFFSVRKKFAICSSENLLKKLCHQFLFLFLLLKTAKNILGWSNFQKCYQLFIEPLLKTKTTNF